MEIKTIKLERKNINITINLLFLFSLIQKLHLKLQSIYFG